MITIDISHLEVDTALQKLKQISIDSSSIECQIDFWTDYSQSKIIRDFIGFLFDNFHVDPIWRWRFVLISDELVNNAIEHGSGPGDLDSCIIRAKEDKNGNFSIILEVHDTGRGKDAKDAEHMEDIKNQKLAEHNENGIHMEKRGRGLFYITERLVDKLSFDESIKWWLAVRVEKNIPIIK